MIAANDCSAPRAAPAVVSSAAPAADAAKTASDLSAGVSAGASVEGASDNAAAWTSISRPISAAERAWAAGNEIRRDSPRFAEIRRDSPRFAEIRLGGGQRDEHRRERLCTAQQIERQRRPRRHLVSANLGESRRISANLGGQRRRRCHRRREAAEEAGDEQRRQPQPTDARGLLRDQQRVHRQLRQLETSEEAARPDAVVERPRERACHLQGRVREGSEKGPRRVRERSYLAPSRLRDGCISPRSARNLSESRLHLGCISAESHHDH